MPNPSPHVENREGFFKRLRPIMAPSELMRVEVAYALAKHGHRAQTRKELDGVGNPVRYFEHLRRTTLILVDELKIHDTDMVVTCLMHDAIEDTQDISDRMLEHLFGTKVAKMVKLLSKDPKEGYYERLKEHGWPEVWIVKGCDRLDNLRSLKGTKPEFQKRQLAETRKVIYPLMNLLCATAEAHERAPALRIRDLVSDAVEEYALL